MSDDADYLMMLFSKMVDALHENMDDNICSYRDFDRFSASAWAIQEVLIDMYEYEYYLTVGIIRSILKEKIDIFDRYYNPARSGTIKFKHALDSMLHLYDITGGYLND